MNNIKFFILENLHMIISIIVVIVIVSAISSYMKRNGVGENEPSCERYRHQPVQQIPADCLQYFQSPDESRITR